MYLYCLNKNHCGKKKLPKFFFFKKKQKKNVIVKNNIAIHIAGKVSRYIDAPMNRATPRAVYTVQWRTVGTSLTSGGIFDPSLTMFPSTMKWYNSPLPSVKTKFSRLALTWPSLSTSILRDVRTGEKYNIQDRVVNYRVSVGRRQFSVFVLIFVSYWFCKNRRNVII